MLYLAYLIPIVISLLSMIILISARRNMHRAKEHFNEAKSHLARTEALNAQADDNFKNSVRILAEAKTEVTKLGLSSHVIDALRAGTVVATKNIAYLLKRHPGGAMKTEIVSLCRVIDDLWVRTTVCTDMKDETQCRVETELVNYSTDHLEEYVTKTLTGIQNFELIHSPVTQ